MGHERSGEPSEPARAALEVDPTRCEPAPHLHEREAQLREVASACAQAEAATGSTIVFRGPPGIGKTALIQAAAAEGMRRGFRTFTARGGSIERHEAFGVVRELFTPGLAALSPDALDELRQGPGREAIALLLREERPHRTAPDSVAYGLYWLLSTFAQQQPIVVAVDDVHWADPPSLRFLGFLAGRVEELSLVLVIAVRSGDPPVDQLALERVLDASATVVDDVPALSVDAVHEIVASTFGAPADDDFAAACRRATGGNPLFLRSLLPDLAARSVPPSAAGAQQVTEFGAASLSRWLRERLSGLSGHAQAVATAVAVLGAKASLRHVALMTGMSMPDAAAVADGLVAMDVLRTGEPLGFRHPILRTAVLGDLGDLERGMLHLRAAGVLADAGAAPNEVSAHLLHAPGAGDARAVRILRAAARAAADRGAPDLAASYLERAVQEPPAPQDTPVILRELGELQLAGGDPAGLDTLMKAHAAAPDRMERAKAARPLMHALVTAGRGEEALRVVSTALRDLGDADTELAYVLEAEAAVWLVRELPGGAWIIDRLEQHARQATGATKGERVLLANLAYKHVLHGDSTAADVGRGAEMAYAHGLLLHDVGADAPSFAAAVTALAHADRLERALEAVDAGFVDARAAGSALAFGYVSILQAGVAERVGDVVEMEAAARAALDLAVANDWHQLLPMALHFLPSALIERGAVDEAEELLARHGYGATDPPDPMPPTYARALVRMKQGRYELALDDLTGARAQGAWWMSGNLMPWRADAARALHAVGRTDEALAMAHEELTLAGRWGTARVRALALRALAQVVGGDDGIDALREAVEITGGTNAELERAKALVDLGRLLRQRHHRSDARAPLRAAAELAARCGATATLRLAEAELAATGADPPRRAPTGPGSLTATQRRLAEMAAAGLTNKQIALELFVSLKTVESHLAAAFRKLGVSSRTELRDALQPGAPASARRQQP